MIDIKYIEGIVVNSVPIRFCEKIRVTLVSGDCIYCKSCGCTANMLQVYFGSIDDSFDIPHRVIEKIEKIEIS